MTALAKALIRFCDKLVKPIEYLTGTMFVLMACVVCWQVFARYIFHKPTAWTGDLSLFLFVWIVLLGSSVALYRHKHIAVTLVLAPFPAGVRRIAGLVSEVVVLACTLLLADTAHTFFMNNLDVVSSGLPISLGWPTASLFVGGSLMVLFSLASLCKTLTPAGGGRS